MEIKELDGYEIVDSDTYEVDDGLATATIEFEDAVNTLPIFLKFKDTSPEQDAPKKKVFGLRGFDDSEEIKKEIDKDYD